MPVDLYFRTDIHQMNFASLDPVAQSTKKIERLNYWLFHGKRNLKKWCKIVILTCLFNIHS